MCKILLVDSYLQSLLISAVLSPGWGQEPKGSCLWVWGRHALRRSRGSRCWSGEGQWSSGTAWWDGGEAHGHVHRELRGGGKLGMGWEMCASAPGDQRLLWLPSF